MSLGLIFVIVCLRVYVRKGVCVSVGLKCGVCSLKRSLVGLRRARRVYECGESSFKVIAREEGCGVFVRGCVKGQSREGCLCC
jgi:hypothetical protein